MAYAPFVVDQSLIPSTMAGAGAGVGAGAAAGAGGLSGLFQNKLFLQYLAGAGADLAAYGGNTDKGFQPNAINAITNQSIQTQNMAKLLKTLLGPDGTKATFSNTGMNLTVPKESSMFSDILGGGDGTFKVDQSLVPSTTPTPTPNNSSVGGGSSVANPFVISQPEMNISASDLAGLTPKDIASAIGMKQAQDQLKQQSYKDMVDAFYKGSTMQKDATAAPIENAYKDALTKKALADIENDKAIYQVPGSDVMLNAKDWIAYQKLSKENQPAAIQVYEYAKTAAGGNFKGSLVEFQNSATTTHMKDYEEAVASGYPKGKFNQWMLEMAKAGAINLGGKLEEKKALSELEGQLYFNNPKWTEDINKQTAEFDKNQAWLVPEKDRPLAKSKVIVKTIEDKIAAGSGAIQSVTIDKDGKTMVWTVKWPSGDVKTIKQAVR